MSKRNKTSSYDVFLCSEAARIHLRVNGLFACAAVRLDEERHQLRVLESIAEEGVIALNPLRFKSETLIESLGRFV